MDPLVLQRHPRKWIGLWWTLGSLRDPPGNIQRATQEPVGRWRTIRRGGGVGLPQINAHGPHGRLVHGVKGSFTSMALSPLADQTRRW